MKTNVLLIVLDTVRAKNTSLHGHYNSTTPFLTEFAESATVYKEARASSIHSVASHASMWSGLHVPEHNITDHEDQLDPERTIWADLQERGYETGIFTRNPVLTQSSNLTEPFETVETVGFETSDDRLFDAFDPLDIDIFEGVSGNFRRAVSSEKPGRALANCAWRAYMNRRNSDKVPEYRTLSGKFDVDNFLQWKTEVDGPWAACINIIDAHHPYVPESQYDLWAGARLKSIYDETSSLKRQFLQSPHRPWGELKAVESIYDGCILQADQVVKHLINSLKHCGEFDNTLIIITSDHGEGFGERSLVTPNCRAVTHSWGLHEELTHVPLVVRYPGQTKPTEVLDPASLTYIPEAIHSTLDGKLNDKKAKDPFTWGPVLSMTERLRPEMKSSFDCDDIDAYCGPWKAVYTKADIGIQKHVVRGDPIVDSGSFIIQSEVRKQVENTSEEAENVVEEQYADLEPANVKQKGKIDANVEKQLEELGYLR